MAEYTNSGTQTVGIGQNVVYTETAVPCCRGYVLHREGSGIVTLRSVVNNYSGFARYKVSFGANLAIPDGGTVEAVSLALAINGEPLPANSMEVTPAAVENFFNVYTSAFITVPRGCCYTVAVENTSTQAVSVKGANIIVERVA